MLNWMLRLWPFRRRPEAREDDFAAVVFHDMIHRSAIMVGATEAAGFRVYGADTNAPRLEKIVHIRPGDASEEVREAALKAFKEIILPCVLKRKPYGAIVVGGSSDAKGEQYCLVRLTLSSEKLPVAASAYIRRCRDKDEALAQLSIISGHACPPTRDESLE
jgi:hypothetical protein